MLERMGETADDTGLSMTQIDAFALAASEVLFLLSGRQFAGARDRTVLARVGRARRDRMAQAALSNWWPINRVDSVTGVMNDNTELTLANTDWTWSGGVFLNVTNRLAHQRVRALVNWGQAPTPGGKLAATALAVELASNDPAYTGDNQTRLPGLMTSRSRQGISESYATVLDAVKEGVTGIQEVDLFVLEYNRTKSRTRPRVRTIR